MGILELFTQAVGQQVSQRGLAVVIAAGFVAFLVLAVVLNVLQQVLFKNPNEPPMVFHWFPIIGSTITYGMDPYGFFFRCKAKVCCAEAAMNVAQTNLMLAWRLLHVYSTRQEDHCLPRTTRQ